MLLKSTTIVVGAASSHEVSSVSWLTIVVVGIIIALVIIAIYKLIAGRGRETQNSKSNIAVQNIEQEKLNKVAKVQEAPKPDNKGVTPITPKEEDREAEEEIVLPMTGRLIYLSEVPDPIYAEQLKGEGFAIEPTEGKINSPVKGTIMEIAPTRHALTIQTLSGRQVLVHFGVEASTLKGEGFVCHVKEGQKVEIGTPLFDIDMPTVSTKIPSVVTSVVFTNLAENERVVVKDTGLAQSGTKGLIVIEQDFTS